MAKSHLIDLDPVKDHLQFGQIGDTKIIDSNIMSPFSKHNQNLKLDTHNITPFLSLYKRDRENSTEQLGVAHGFLLISRVETNLFENGTWQS